MALGESIDVLLYDVVRAPDFASHTRRGHGVQPSDLVRRLAGPLVEKAWAERHGRRPDLRAVLDPVDRERAQAIVTELRVLLVELAAVASETVSGVVSRARLEGHPVRPSDLGEKVLTRLCNYAVAHGTTPPASWDAAVAVELLAGLPKDRLEPGEFAKRYAVTWDVAWTERGSASLDAFPPSRIGLGADSRPPLFAQRGRICNWRVGTDRSLYDRYALLWRGVSASIDPGRDVPGHLVPTPRSQDCNHAAEEIARACAPYGLAAQPHQRDLVAVCLGSFPSDRESARDWRDYARTCREAVGPEHEVQLSAAVASYLRDWSHSEGARLLSSRLGRLDMYVDAVGNALVRKVWMDLHRREREAVEPACTCALGRYVRTAVEKGIAEALLDWFPSGVVSANDDFDVMAAGGPAVEDAAVEFEARRENATVQLLLDHPDVALAAFERRAGWEHAYSQLSGGDLRGGPGFLDNDELAAYVDRHIPSAHPGASITGEGV